MTRAPLRLHSTALAAALCAALTIPAAAQTAKAPKTQLWIDLSTGSMAGMPEMDGLPGAGMLGGMLGGGRPGAGGGNTSYGMARANSIMPPRVIDIALHNSLRPGVEAAQLIPPGMRMGEQLPLLPPRAEPATRGEPGDVPQEYERQQPKGRILVYWGCGAQVRAGQPRVVDLVRARPQDFAQAFSGRMVPDRGAKVGPSHALYPNERNQVQLSRESSLVGEHRITGQGVPASMKFTLGEAQDLMPAIDLRTTGRVQDSVQLAWQPVRNARAYYLHAMMQNGDDLILWSSAETPDTGMGLFDYLPGGTIDRWVKDRVLLAADATQCAVPQGIFAGSGRDATPMLRMMAYGGETNLVYPPRPADPKAAWEPEWSVRVRVKSHTMAMLGEDSGPARRSGRAMPAGADAPPVSPGAPMGQAPADSGVDGGNPMAPVNPVNLLRGIFGR